MQLVASLRCISRSLRPSLHSLSGLQSRSLHLSNTVHRSPSDPPAAPSHPRSPPIRRPITGDGVGGRSREHKACSCGSRSRIGRACACECECACSRADPRSCPGRPWEQRSSCSSNCEHGHGQDHSHSHHHGSLFRPPATTVTRRETTAAATTPAPIEREHEHEHEQYAEAVSSAAAKDHGARQIQPPIARRVAELVGETGASPNPRARRCRRVLSLIVGSN